MDFLSFLFTLLLFIFLWLASIYQRMSINQDHVEKAWDLLDHELKTRAHLVPNLIGAIERHTLEQKEQTQTLEELKKVISQKMNISQREHIETAITRSLHRLFLEIKSQPILEHDALISDILKKFDTVEEDLFLTRQIYNSAVLRAKSLLSSFPGNYIGEIFNFPQPPFFDHPMTNQEIFKHIEFPKF